MRRRDFIAGLGSAAAWPRVARAQQDTRVRRIGVLMPNENDPLGQAFVSAFTQALEGLGWSDGRNVRMDLRWVSGDINRMRAFAHELVGLQPDIIVASPAPATVALQRETRTIPIVFVNVTDPVASGFVASLNQPGGNITGFGFLEASMGGKWLELLSEVAPGLKRVAIMFNPDTAPASLYLPSFEAAARSLKVVSIVMPVRGDVEIETAIIALGREPRGGLVVMADVFMFAHRTPIISAAARNNVPAVYWQSDFARGGGLLSYGADLVDNWRRAAPYVDRILRGAKPADLPVPVGDTEADISRAIESFARTPNGGLVLPPDFVLTEYRDLIITLAARYQLPAIYSDRAGRATASLIASMVFGSFSLDR
jgi:putative tryptophan/tyrosine transport system substrate-binding protein